MLLRSRLVNTNPKFLAEDTKAFSSGDWAWYSNFPVKKKQKCHKFEKEAFSEKNNTIS